LELALDGPLDGETRENLNQSHAASKVGALRLSHCRVRSLAHQSLLFTINDLLDLTRLESGQDTSFNEPFDLHHAIEEAINIYRNEAHRRNLQFVFEVSGPRVVVGDSRKIRTVVANLTANACGSPNATLPHISRFDLSHLSEILYPGENHRRV